ncbi:hypothetical protein ABPG74_000638 [Tetrahymena malaccensis]
MNKLKLFYNSFSQPSRAVKCLLKIGKVDYEERFVNLAKGDQFKPEVKDLNWNSQVPFIEDNGFVVFESHTIMRYIHQRFNLDNSLYPQQLQEKTKIDMYLDWHHTNTRRSANYVTASLLSKRTGQPSLYVEDLVHKELLKAIQNLNDNLLNNPSHYIFGFQKPTIADISCYQELTELKLINFDFKKYPNLDAFMNQMSIIPEIKEVDKDFSDIALKIFKVNL